MLQSYMYKIRYTQSPTEENFLGDWKIAGGRKEETDSVRITAWWRDKAWNK